MRLGTDTGSMTNYLLSGTVGAPEPEVGMGATRLMWTDRKACTIVEVEYFKSGPNKGKAKAVVVQQDIAVRTDNNGMSECQVYEFKPDPAAYKERYTLRKNGAFVKAGGNGQLRIGERDQYYDFSF